MAESDERASDRRDERTRVVPRGFRSNLAPVIVDGAAALDRAATARDTDRDRWAVLVVASWLDEAGVPQLRSWLREGAGKDAPIVVSVGAHSHSDVGPIEGASLRHVLLIADPALRGALLDIVDLHTPHGFEADGAPGVRQLETLVPQRFALGSADIVALLLEPGEGVHDGWARAQRPGVLALASKGKTGAAAAVRAHAPACEVSIQYPNPIVTALDDRASLVRAQLARAATREGITRVVGAQIADDTVRISATEAELQAGILIGRDDRCAAGAADTLMSRVHAFVRTRGDGLLVADAGPTTGTRVVDGAQVTALDRGARALVVREPARLLCGETHVVIARTSR